jgi:hypothetical protein
MHVLERQLDFEKGQWTMVFGIQAEMPIGFKFNEWNLPLDQEPHRFMNFT